MAPRRRDSIDSLASCDSPRWLVVRDRCSRVLEYRELPPRTDLRAALKAKGDGLAAAGWNVEDTPRNCAFFFCDRGDDRWCVSIDHFEPGRVPVGHGSFLAQRPSPK